MTELSRSKSFSRILALTTVSDWEEPTIRGLSRSTDSGVEDKVYRVSSSIVSALVSVRIPDLFNIV